MTDRFTTRIEDLSRIKYELELFLLGGGFVLREDDRLVLSVESAQAAAEISYGKLILSCWGDGWSRSWRVIACSTSHQRLRLHCTKQMGRTLCTLDLLRGSPAPDTDHSRARFTARLSAMIESTFTGFKVERAVASRYDSSHLSGVHTRLVIRDRNSVIAAIAAGDGESQANVDAALGAGIIWLDALQRRPHAVDRLMIFAPCGRAATIATRLTAIHLKGVTISLYEVDEATGAINPVAAYDQGDLADRLRRAARRATWPGEQPLPSDVSALVEQTVRLAPDLIESRRQGGWIKLSIRGLEFARISVARKLVEFGLGERKQRLCDENYSALEKLILDIITDRAASSDRRDELIFRAQSERWLESVIRREVTAIDPRLDARYVYSQVPIYRGDGRAFIDLLAATREGRLVVIELKVTEDAEFPFQGLDYWLRVEWHRLRGDFRRRGYFRELRLADRAPLVYLVAPLFRFHATTKLLAGSIAGRVPVYRIGINEDWRSRVRVLLSEKLN